MYNMTRNEIYKELQKVDELHSNSKISTNESKARMRWLISLIPITKYDRVRWVKKELVKLY